jgi:glycine oxidase
MIFDIVIIGRGILSLSTAFSLMQMKPNLKIAIVGPRNRIGMATEAAGAMLNCFSEVTTQTFNNKYNIAKFEMSLKALDLWPLWIESINSYLPEKDKIVISRGTYTILNTKSGKLDSENFSLILKSLKEYNEEFEEVETIDIPGLNPIEDCRPTKAIYIPREGFINPIKLTDNLINILVNNFNVQFIEQKAVKLERKSNQISSIATDQNNHLYASEFILATGSYTQTLLDNLPEISSNIPKIFSGTGYSLLMEQDDNNSVSTIIRTPNRAGACGLHALPQEGYLYLGASNNLWLTPQTQVSSGLAHFILECAIEQINQNLSSSRIIKWNVGNRPVTLDTFPLIGRTSINNLSILTGTYRDGIHQSPYLAKYMSDIVLQKSEISKNLFTPERNLIQIFSVEDSIKDGVIHYMSGGYERGMKLPKAGWDSLLKEMIQERLTNLYKDLEINYGLAPEFLMMFEFAKNRQELVKYFKSVFSSYN